MPAVPVIHGTTFAHSVRVYYEDTDAGGVVYYANYLKFFERARTEWLRALGFDQGHLARTENRIFVVRSAHTDYRSPARLDDTLVIHTGISRLGRASLEFSQRCERDGLLLAAGVIAVCCVDATTLRPAALPPAMATALAALSPTS